MASPNSHKEQQFPALARERPLYGRMDCVAKPMNSMHFDELLKNVTSIEEGQLMQNPSSSSSSSSSNSSSPGSLARGNFNLNETFCKKTVDEVWKDIVHQEDASTMETSRSHHQNLGETTLEDFLVRAGVINVGYQNGSLLDHQPVMGLDPVVVVPQQEDWYRFQMATAQQQHQMTMLGSNFHASSGTVYDSSVMDMGQSESQMVMAMSMSTMSAKSSESQEGVDKKRRFSEETMEKTIERRQKRMIKNRQSAARSRARKQAYINQLENKVFQLTEKNKCLKKHKEVDMALSSDVTRTVPRYQLRRTSSCSL
ncbi:hypothetical protein K2173_023104 [Erythroxylum novogranatense]|uniref:BZIP domain-containing protein n=1 Tax=Erythroxylum novogranatense TaxID=1862640 RepID=A0AAV8T9U2_9ROSI|nr:hypothetical protein K2173_023104 [Erythroxylum novogranatense]